MRLAPANAQNSNAPDITVTLLGTGSPIPDDPERMNATTLVRAGQEVLLFDAGRGVVERLSQANLKGKDITAVFLTHFHSDHTVGLPDFWLTSRLRIAWGSRTTPMEVWGPTGNVEFIQNLAKAFSSDVHARPTDTQIELVGHEFSRDGVVFNRNGVTVTDHGVSKPAVGYRVDYNGHAVLAPSQRRDSGLAFRSGLGLLKGRMP